MDTTRIADLDALHVALPVTPWRRLALRCLAAVAATASALSAQAGDYEIVPGSSTLSLAGSGRITGTGSIDYKLPPVAEGSGSFDIAGDLAFVPVDATKVSIPAGGRIEASRQGGAWAVTLASVAPSGLEGAGIALPAWRGALQGTAAISDINLPASFLSIIATTLGDHMALDVPLSASSVRLTFGGTAPLASDGSFDVSMLHAAVGGDLDIDGRPMAWSTSATPLQPGAGRDGERDDGTLLMSFVGQWHQTFALPALSFEDSIDVGGGRLEGSIASTVDWDWTLSGELLAVATPLAVAEPPTGWLHAIGLLALLATLRRRAALRWHDDVPA